jgi:hypothetical protein
MTGEARSRQSYITASKKEGTGIGEVWMARNKTRKAESQFRNQSRMSQMAQPCISARAELAQLRLLMLVPCLNCSWIQNMEDISSFKTAVSVDTKRR